MSRALSALLERVHLEAIDLNLFRGYPGERGFERLYGGEIMAQAINAAYQTVASQRQLHSLHCYFLRPGDPALPVVYEVERIRDGRSFTTRRVVALQRSQAIFNASLSFQQPEDGPAHGRPMPELPGPEGRPSERERQLSALGAAAETGYGWPVEFRPLDPLDYRQPEVGAPLQRVWLRADGQLADDPGQHQEILAYASDIPALVTALRPHGINQWTAGVQLASLDHALWFHRPFRIDDWLLYEIDSPAAGGGRGFVQGRLYNRAGELVASVAQEGLFRYRPD